LNWFSLEFMQSSLCK